MKIFHFDDFRIANFESTGLAKIDARLAEYYTKLAKPGRALTDLFAGASITFTLEGISRLHSMLLCELNNSFVQQSQRYVRLNPEGITLPKHLPKEYADEAMLLFGMSCGLYSKMTKVKDPDKKGRTTIDDYVYGIPIEDARYLLPLAAKTNLQITLVGQDILRWFDAIHDNWEYYTMLSDIAYRLSGCLGANVEAFIRARFMKTPEDESSYFYEVYPYNWPAGNGIELLYTNDLEREISSGALTSSTAGSPVDKNRELSPEKRKSLIQRVTGYGHTAILEQGTITFKLRLSLSAFHQWIRHRMASRCRPDILGEYTFRISHMIHSNFIIPPTIQGTEFENEYIKLVNDYKKFRSKLIKNNFVEESALFLLNCNMIDAVQTTNVRALNWILRERTCRTAQWEIRKIATELLKQLRAKSDILFEDALPPCCKPNGVCKEGKMTCGQMEDVRREWNYEG